ESEPLEDAQRRKLARVCAKLDLRPGHELLDIGCGWGTLALFAAERHGVRATGVTLAERGASHGNRRIEAAGLGDRARIACLDYRCLPDHVYDRIVSLEMVEHVGVRHLAEYFAVVRDHLRDDGLFLLQWCGLRRGGAGGVAPIGLRPEDMIWGLFMNEHIFSGADASLPLSAMTRAMETAGFEIQSVENWSPHYVLTIRRWHERWERHRSHICRAYGESWYRLWRLFLAWSWRIGAQGASVCYQVVAHKNLDSFPRAALFGPGAGARPAAAVTAIDASLTDHAASDVTAA
ncbi:MAG TPA: class I SAM-dependent methyltransferase, partial [Polyangiaceae bacterium]|nr:class I SAM-dependent methyltransferase [Polyangiaceae bacterium]